LDEGRLEFHEYDGRLRDAYAARTYGELDRLVMDLPGALPVAPAELPVAREAPVAPAELPVVPADATRRWLVATWDDYAGTVAICVAIWLGIVLTGGGWAGFWPIWVAGPWGAYLAYETVRGLATGEPERWARKQQRKREIRQRRRDARRALPRAPEDAEA
jgi:hypothetical protein